MIYQRTYAVLAGICPEVKGMKFLKSILRYILPILKWLLKLAIQRPSQRKIGKWH